MPYIRLFNTAQPIKAGFFNIWHEPGSNSGTWAGGICHHSRERADQFVHRNMLATHGRDVKCIYRIRVIPKEPQK